MKRRWSYIYHIFGVIIIQTLCMRRGQAGAVIKKTRLPKHITQVLFDVKIDIRNEFYAPENFNIPGLSSKYKFTRDIQST